jgi:methionine-rich copper-binding protein CopC
MKRLAKHRLVPTLGALLVAVLSPGRAAAHEEGVLRLADARATAGRTLEVGGEKFSAGTPFRLLLKGALKEYELTTVETDAQGNFSLVLPIPATVEPGAYRLVAVAPDGDDAAAADLEIEAAPAAPEEAPDEEGAHAALESQTPSAEELAIERSWSGIEWFVIGMLFGAALTAGIVGIRSGESGNPRDPATGEVGSANP